MKFIATDKAEPNYTYVRIDTTVIAVDNNGGSKDGDTLYLSPGEVVELECLGSLYDLTISNSIEPENHESFYDIEKFEQLLAQSLVKVARDGGVLPADGEAYDWLVANGVEPEMDRPTSAIFTPGG